MRALLLGWASVRGEALFGDPGYVKTKLAVVLGHMLKRDYPERWPSAWQDILGALGGHPATIDLLLRLCGVLQQEVVEPRSNRPVEELAHNALIKDSMRDTGVNAALVDVFYRVATNCAASRPSLTAFALAVFSEFVHWIDIRLVVDERWQGLYYPLLLGTASAGGADPAAALAGLPGGGVAGSSVFHDTIRTAMTRVLVRTLQKGMPVLARMDVIRRMSIVELLQAVGEKGELPGLCAPTPRAAAAAGAAPGFGAMARPGSAAARLPGEAESESAAQLVMSLGGGGAGDGGAGSAGSEFPNAFGELVCATGQALLQALEAEEVLGSAEAAGWVSGAARATLEVTLRMLTASAEPTIAGNVFLLSTAASSTYFADGPLACPPAVCVQLMPLLHDCVALYNKQHRAATAPPPGAAGSGGATPFPAGPSGSTAFPPAGMHRGAPSSSSIASASSGGPRTPAPGAAAGKREQRPRAGSSSMVAGGSPGLAGKDAAAGLALAAASAAVFPVAEYIPRFINLFPARFTLPLDHNFDMSLVSSEEGGDEADDEEEDAADAEAAGDEEDADAVRQLREELRRLLVNICRINPEGVVATLAASGMFDGAALAAALPSCPWNQTECTLAALHFCGEGAAAYANAAQREGRGAFFDAVVAAASCGVPQGTSAAPVIGGGPALRLSAAAAAAAKSAAVAAAARGPHFSVLAQYYELLARYAGVLLHRPALLPAWLHDMVGPAGLRHTRPSVRSRTAFLLLRLVKSIVKGVPDVLPAKASEGLLAPYADALLTGIHEFLSVPFVASAPKGSPAGAGAGGAASAPGGPRTRGPAGLGSEDQQYLFEVVGLVLGAPWLGADKKVAYTEAVLLPLAQQLEEGLGALGALSGPPPFSMADVIAWLERILGVLAGTVKGLGNVSGNESLTRIMGRLLQDGVRAVAVLPSAPAVRQRVGILVLRLVDAMDTALLPLCSELVFPFLLQAASPEDASQAMAIVNFMIHKLRKAVAPLVAAFFLPMLSRIFELMPPPPPLAPAAPTAGAGAAAAYPPRGHAASFGGGRPAGGVGGAGPFASMLGRSGSSSSGVPSPLLAAMTGAGLVVDHASLGASASGGAGGATTLSTSHGTVTLRRGIGLGAGAGKSEPDAPATISAATTERNRARTDLQRSFSQFLFTIALNGLAADVLTAPENLPQLAEILASPSAIITALTDLNIARSLISLLTHLLRSWLPIAGLTVGVSSGALSVTFASPTAAAAVAAGAPAPPPPTGAPGVAGSAAAAALAALPPYEAYAAHAQPSPLSPEAASAFFAACLEALPRTPFALALAPQYSPADANSLMALGDGANLLLAWTVHLSAHSPPHARAAPVEVVGHLVRTTLPSLGLPDAACQAVGQALLVDLARSPHEACRDPAATKVALLAAVQGIRASALASAASLEAAAAAGGLPGAGAPAVPTGGAGGFAAMGPL